MLTKQIECQTRPDQASVSRRLLVQRRQTIMSGQPLHPVNNSNRRKQEAGVSAAGSQCTRALSGNTGDASDSVCARVVQGEHWKPEQSADDP